MEPSHQHSETLPWNRFLHYPAHLRHARTLNHRQLNMIPSVSLLPRTNAVHDLLRRSELQCRGRREVHHNQGISQRGTTAASRDGERQCTRMSKRAGISEYNHCVRLGPRPVGQVDFSAKYQKHKNDRNAHAEDNSQQ
jgi:hypothetical protein